MSTTTTPYPPTRTDWEYIDDKVAALIGHIKSRFGYTDEQACAAILDSVNHTA